MSTAPAVISKTKIPHVRVTAPSTTFAIHSAGADWAGVSELPKADFTEAQLAALKLDKRLQVEVFDREPAVDPQAAAE
jgi:hypothetical protein